MISLKGVDFVISDTGAYRVENPPQWLFDNEDIIKANVERAMTLAGVPLSETIMTVGLIALGLLTELGGDREFWLANLRSDEDAFCSNMSNAYNTARKAIVAAYEEDDEEDCDEDDVDVYTLEFERQVATVALRAAKIECDPYAIEIIDSDLDRIHFKVPNVPSKVLFVRMWNVEPCGDGDLWVEYSLFVENANNGADKILDAKYVAKIKNSEPEESAVLDKVNWKTNTYAFRDGFMVDIVETEDTYDCYLYHKQYGIKSSMFGLPKEYFACLADVESLVLANLCEENYIKYYKEEYMH